MRVLESRIASTSGGGAGSGGVHLSPAPSISRILRAPSPTGPARSSAPAAAPQLMLRPKAGAGARQRAPGGAAAGGAAAPNGTAAARAQLSKEEERLRQIILAEVLDRKPNVGFADVAGLKSAKQALQEAVILPRWGRWDYEWGVAGWRDGDLLVFEVARQWTWRGASAVKPLWQQFGLPGERIGLWGRVGCAFRPIEGTSVFRVETVSSKPCAQTHTSSLFQPSSHPASICA